MASTWLYTYAAATTEPPAAGQVRFDVGVEPYADITRLWFRYISSDGFDLFYALGALPVAARLILQDKNDHTRMLEVRVTGAPVDKGTHFEVPVAWVQGGAVAFAGGQDVAIVELAGSDVLPPEPPGPPGSLATYGGSWSSPVFSLLVTAPTTEPITLDEAKLRAGLAWAAGDPRDGLMRDFIAAARAKVEHDTGLALLTQTRDLYYTGARLYGASILNVAPQCRPLQSVVSVEPIDPTTGEPIPLTPPVSSFSTVRLAPWTVVEGQAVRARLIAGWLDVPALRAQAPTLLQAVGLLTAHYATLGRDLASIDTVTEIPLGYCDLIAPWIPVVLP